MKLTWYGQSAFRVEAGGAAILIDPFLSGNPLWGKGWEEASKVIRLAEAGTDVNRRAILTPYWG